MASSFNYLSTSVDVSSVSLDAISKYMQVLLLRNFATGTWVFSSRGAMQSVKGCVLASPSLPDDRGQTDQDYVHHWIRDAAICIPEALDNPVFMARNICEDYTMSRRCARRTPSERAGSRWRASTSTAQCATTGPRRRMARRTAYCRSSPSRIGLAAGARHGQVHHREGHLVPPLGLQGADAQPLEETAGFSFYARSCSGRRSSR